MNVMKLEKIRTALQVIGAASNGIANLVQAVIILKKSNEGKEGSK